MQMDQIIMDQIIMKEKCSISLGHDYMTLGQFRLSCMDNDKLGKACFQNKQPLHCFPPPLKKNKKSVV